MILHHYDLSPYSEKIRLMFGYTGLAWQSAISPPMPPRPIVDPLVGGYRRIPVAQIGADLFCDTRIIAAEIAALSNRPELAYTGCSSQAQSFIDQTYSERFMAIVQTAVPKSVLAMLVTRYWPWQIVKLMKDRAGIGKTSNMPRVKRSDLEVRLDQFKAELEQQLLAHDFLFSDTPTLADFAAYHLVWFADLTRPGVFLDGCDKALAWQARMKAFGHGNKAKISRDFVFQTALESQPRGLSAELLSHPDVGASVSIEPNDYARDSVTGLLVGADDSRWVIARHTKQFGILHVHFPTSGYQLTTNGH
ncbi:glutathione S-transferase family protein [Arenicella xantha]|uniref:Glutathione S-transferase n=1 Tax=Arenicella xantha TaxID=644221 RepID=A0A395JLQ9_9GAMM|nr:glutathione S-transferase family protein [Arenicella xantha]RBP51736.1 glutathione S-transferase [Arenicella xantha]